MGGIVRAVRKSHNNDYSNNVGFGKDRFHVSLGPSSSSRTIDGHNAAATIIIIIVVPRGCVFVRTIRFKNTIIILHARELPFSRKATARRDRDVRLAYAPANTIFYEIPRQRCSRYPVESFWSSVEVGYQQGSGIL